MKKPAEQYFRFPRRLLTSPAWSVLNIHERRAFDRLMEEHQSKSGFVNDGLVVTRRDFVSAHVPPKHVRGSWLVLVNLGIIKCTRSMGGSKSGRTPNMWKPTFLPSTPMLDDATHDYLEIKTVEEAKRIAEQHRSHEKRKGRMPQKHRKLRAVSLPSIATSES
jgi:hypothetical protein